MADKKGMKLKLGIDLGMSSTKVVLVSGRLILDRFIFEKNDRLSMLKKVNELVLENNLRKVYVTGGKSKLSFKAIAVSKVDEIKAIGLGGSILAGHNKCVVASVGTGTCIVSVDKIIKHVGGTGVGGGTLEGLCRAFVDDDICVLSELADKGKLGNVDYRVQDIVGNSIGILPKTATASNLGKLNDKTKKSDLALGIINLVAEAVSVVVIYSARYCGNKKIVIVGRTPKIKKVKQIMENTAKLFNLEFIFPDNMEYATAFGATQVG